MPKSGNNSYEDVTIPADEDVYCTISRDSHSYISRHWHPELELIYIISGTLEVMIDESTTFLRENEFCVINPYILHSTKNLYGNKALLMQIPKVYLSRYVPNAARFIFQVDIYSKNPITQTKVLQLKDTFKLLTILKLYEPDFGKLRFQGLLFNLLYQLYHNFSIELPQSIYNSHQKTMSRLNPILEYTQRHYQQPISVVEIAAIAGFCPEYFCKFFKKNMGITYLEYLNELRLSHIYIDLLTTDLTVKDILEKHGFTNYKLFRRMFDEKFHQTPTAARKSKFQ